MPENGYFLRKLLLLELCPKRPAVTHPTLLELCLAWPVVPPPTVVTPWMQSPIRPHNPAASVHCMHNLPSPIKYNGLPHTVLSTPAAGSLHHDADFAREVSSHAYSCIQLRGRSIKTMNANNTKESSFHENADANVTCHFGEGDISRCRSMLHGQPRR